MKKDRQKKLEEKRQHLLHLRNKVAYTNIAYKAIVSLNLLLMGQELQYLEENVKIDQINFPYIIGMGGIAFFVGIVGSIEENIQVDLDCQIARLQKKIK